MNKKTEEETNVKTENTEDKEHKKEDNISKENTEQINYIKNPFNNKEEFIFKFKFLLWIMVL